MQVRRAGATMLVALALAMVVATSLAFIDTHGYLVLRRLAHPFAGTAIAVLLLAVAARLAYQRPILVAGISWLAIVIAAAVLMAGARHAKLARPYAEVEGPIVATSPGYEVVTYRAPTPGGDIEVLRVRSRAGLASREGRVNVACFAARGPGVASASLLTSVEFAGENRLVLRTADGTSWPVAFDPVTLAPEVPVNRCPARVRGAGENRDASEAR